ncbi:hypothetical protein B0A55_02369 [Friedmanniomyces simplex]|uniref:Beta-lactamase-related domain-containing protein n=1 Tax=Friedmanniomyces simplex TaxID=329884 RepID=A0A4U0Y160_9PEZI|nr:hypothetical protein B0A55_02369 [Friedmanniomyces simplex]
MAQQDPKHTDTITKIKEILTQNVVLGYADIVRQEPIDNEHLFGIGSITKVFVAVVTLQLIEEGRLQLTDTVKQHLTPDIYHDIDCAETASVDQLLSHRAGIDSWEQDPTWITHGRGRDMRPAYTWKRAETLDYIRRPKLHAPAPGEYYYANTNYTLLGLIIEKVTQSTAESQIRLRILQPLGMNHTFLEGFEEASESKRRIPQVGDELIDVTGSNLSVSWLAGGMISSTTDLLKLGIAMQNGVLLTPASMANMQCFRPTTRPGEEMGCGLFRMQLPQDKGAWLGHSANVGIVNTGGGSAVTSIIRESEFMPLAAQLVQA